MKTLKQINEEIREVEMKLKDSTGRSKTRKYSREIVRLRQLRIYLEFSPSQTYLEQTRDALARNILILSGRYNAWISTRNASNYKNPKTAFMTEMGIPGMRNQLSTLRYLLDQN
jgi:hypothetical protein